MGQKIDDSHFSDHDFRVFSQRLHQETELLVRWVKDGRFPELPLMGGLELECWLVDRNGDPAPVNRPFLELADDPLIVPELARFNIELNSKPQVLAGKALSRMAGDLDTRWRHCRRAAAQLDADVVMTGILPTAREDQFTVDNMSDQARYRALNEQVFRSRRGEPLRLRIQGRDRLDAVHHDVMLEAATTSFQAHLRVPPDRAAAFYNAALLMSPLMVAACANSPYLFGRDLWMETRVPVFEQAVASPPRDGCRKLGGRVTFGDRFARGDLTECFRQNDQCFVPLLPMEVDKYPASLSHLRLHNGTIWRWNRPLIGFEEDGHPHFRIEHRTVSAGPTVEDCIANATLFFGLSLALVDECADLADRLDFGVLREDFYSAARIGLASAMTWLDGRRHGLTALLSDVLLPRCDTALKRSGLDPEDVAHYLGVIGRRVTSGNTGAQWQRVQCERFQGDMRSLLMAYMAHQESGRPVHEWGVE